MEKILKPVKIKYNSSGVWEDLSDFLRQYSTDNVLKNINKETFELFNNKNNSDIPAVKHVSIPLYNKRSFNTQKKEAYITAWTLTDLAYYIIKTSNDYRGRDIQHKEELYLLQMAVDDYIQREEHLFLESNKQEGNNVFFLHLWGFVGEQFKSENPKIVFDNFSRDLYMLFELNNSSDFDMEKAVQKEMGMSWKKVVQYLILAWFGFTQESTLNELIDKILESSPDEKKEFKQVIERYTTNYDEVRNSMLGRQILYAKPYVRTQKGEVVSVSTYLNFFLCEHSILWIIRDHFNKQKSQDFTNYFGDLFEKYFNEILECCLKENEYERIAENGINERADWKINICGNKFLVEQKSTIMRLSAKQQQTDISAIKDFAKRTVLKAMSQLANTEQEIGEGKYIKIILLFEDYLRPELLEQFINMSECNVKNDNYFWLVTINEMEMLLYLAKNDQDLFDEIVKEKINRETSNSKLGKSIIQLLNEYGINKNEYIMQERFIKYRNTIFNI